MESTSESLPCESVMRGILLTRLLPLKPRMGTSRCRDHWSGGGVQLAELLDVLDALMNMSGMRTRKTS
jgi:hypothetical protein